MNSGKCGDCIFAHFPIDEATGARKWAGVCGNHLPEGMTVEEMKRRRKRPVHYVEQGWKCSNGRYKERYEAGVGSTEQKGED